MPVIEPTIIHMTHEGMYKSSTEKLFMSEIQVQITDIMKPIN